MTDERQSKVCGVCGFRFFRGDNTSRANWEKQRFCSRECGSVGQRRPGPVKQKRTHCKSGRHEWKPENLYVDNRGGKKCKLCQRDPLPPRSPQPAEQKKPTQQRRRPKRRPRVRESTPVAAPSKPTWRPSTFPPVPNTRRSA